MLMNDDLLSLTHTLTLTLTLVHAFITVKVLYLSVLQLVYAYALVAYPLVHLYVVIVCDLTSSMLYNKMVSRSAYNVFTLQAALLLPCLSCSQR